MKAVNNAELIWIKKHNNITEIAELEEEILEIINQNCISSVQMAMMYLLNCEGIIDKKTEEKIKGIIHNVLGE